MPLLMCTPRHLTFSPLHSYDPSVLKQKALDGHAASLVSHSSTSARDEYQTLTFKRLCTATFHPLYSRAQSVSEEKQHLPTQWRSWRTQPSLQARHVSFSGPPQARHESEHCWRRTRHGRDRHRMDDSTDLQSGAITQLATITITD